MTKLQAQAGLNIISDFCDDHLNKMFTKWDKKTLLNEMNMFFSNIINQEAKQTQPQTIIPKGLKQDEK